MTAKKKHAPSAKTPASKGQRAKPAFVTPMAAQVVKKLPEGNDWAYELKFDGYRALAKDLAGHKQRPRFCRMAEGQIGAVRVPKHCQSS